MSFSPVEEKIIITEFGVCNFVKLINLCFFLYDYKTNKDVGHFLRIKYKWTNSFFVKMALGLFISVNYTSMLIELVTVSYINFIYFFNSVTWILSLFLLYFEYIRKLPQSWLGLRTFWLSNAILYIGKLIFFCYLTFTNTDDEDHIYYKKILFYNCVQFIPSLCLGALSIFKPYDTLNDTESLKKITNEIENDDNPSIIHSLIELNITEIKANKYIQGSENLLIPVQSNKDEIVPEKIKFRFSLKLQDGKTQSIKKSLSEIMDFNYSTYAKFKQSAKSSINNSTLIIQLKNLTDIFTKKSVYESKLKELQIIYLNLCQSFPEFLDDFFAFTNIEDEETKKKLKESLCRKSFNSKDSSVMKVNAMISLSESSSEFGVDKNTLERGPQSLDSDHNLEIVRGNVNEKIMKNNDVYKIVGYISTIVTSSSPEVKVTVKSIREKAELLDSDIICNFSFENEEFQVEFSIKGLTTILKENNKISSTSLSKEFIGFLKNSKNLIALTDADSKERKAVENYLTKILNNIFYLNEVTFSFLGINSLINLDLEEVDMEIVNNFFELDYNVYESTDYINSFYYNSTFIEISFVSMEKLYDDFLFRIKLKCKEEKEHIREIYISELDKACKDIIELNRSYNRFHSLTRLLSRMVELIQKVRNENQEEAIPEMIDIFRSLKEKKNMYAFFDIYFRGIFDVEEYNTEKMEEKEDPIPSGLRRGSSANASMLEELLS